MVKKTTIIIPTYDKRIETDNTLPNLLESIKNLKERDFNVIILNNTINIGYHKKIEVKINNIIKPFKKDFKITQIGYKDLEKLYNYFHKNNYPDFIDHIHLKGYSNFRNLGLIIANIMGTDIVIFLDDDEIIEDKDFLKKAREFIGKSYKRKFIGGIAGYYINKDGSYTLPRYKLKKQWWSIFWNKPKHMNKAFKIIGSRKRLNETSFAFAGNMVLHKKMFRKVPFDPYIQRGEDIDLLINAKYLGYTFLLDNKLGIKHLPPTKTRSDVWLGIRRDAYRFVYKRRKVLDLIKDKKLEKDVIKSLCPYPGYFIRKDIYLRLIITSFLLGLNVFLLGKFKDASEHFKNIKISLIDANKYAIKNSKKYFKLQKRWAILMANICKDKYLKKHFNDKLR